MTFFTVETRKIVHEDERRSIKTIFNGSFIAQQTKILEVFKDSILGNHYHEYKECFFVLKGSAEYTLEDIRSGRRIKVNLSEGDRLIIDSKVAHKAYMRKGTIMIESTEQPYKSSKLNDTRYEIE